MNLFDKEFYPTPPEVIKKMIEPYADILDKATVLEPSAGSGSIIDYITETGLNKTLRTTKGHEYDYQVKANPKRVYAIEKNPELQMILQQKGYRLIGEDFLGCFPDTRVNLILMNPPFKNGDQHLLHAWEILHGGDIACLLNAETIRNPYTENRKLLARIIAEHGSVEELGKCFRDADNTTDVEVTLVRLHKEDKASPFRIDLSGEEAPRVDFVEMTSEGNALCQSSRLDAYIRCWSMAKEAAVDYIKSREKLRFWLSALMNTDLTANGKAASSKTGVNAIQEIDNELKGQPLSQSTMESAYNEFITAAKGEAWDTVFRQIGIGKYMTTGLREELSRFQKGQASMDITKENVMKLFEYIMTNVGVIMDNAVVEVYDKFTRYFKDNTSFKEGWKTNKQFHCNRKVILPDLVDAGFMPQKYGYHSHFSLELYGRQTVEDIDKAMCWLSGRSFDSLTGEIEIPGQGKCPSPKDSTIAQTINRIAVGDQGWYESAFFRVKAFKKGTVHLEFKDEALWTKFNITVNKGKNQLGNSEAA